MKKFVLISVSAILIIVGVLATSVLSQKSSSILTAFHESLKQEDAKQYPKAIQSLEAGYKQSKDDYLVNLRLGWLHYLAKNYDESKKYYAQAFSLSGSKSVEALLGRTLPLSAVNDWDAVVGAYMSILRLDPMNYSANLRLGQIMLNRGMYAEAKEYLEKAHTAYPGSYEPNLSLGWTHYYLGNKQKATSLLTTALMLSPGDSLATRGLNLLK
ncbi:MAG: tetratricopeptide repeat protein [Ignavibacteriae bacterium]|nr:tetratricopeptide repeat protein [Ignavibacteriota bacterium]